MHKYGTEDIYKFYRSTVINPVDHLLFKSIWKEFADTIIDTIILEGKDFTMPFRVGVIGIRKRKIRVRMNSNGTIDKRNLKPDWKATKLLWERDKEAKERKQLVFHLNKHFGGFSCKWFWDKSTCSIPNQSAYSLTITRSNKRKLAKILLEGKIEVDYYEQRPLSYGKVN